MKSLNAKENLWYSITGTWWLWPPRFWRNFWLQMELFSTMNPSEEFLTEMLLKRYLKSRQSLLSNLLGNYTSSWLGLNPSSLLQSSTLQGRRNALQSHRNSNSGVLSLKPWPSTPRKTYSRSQTSLIKYSVPKLSQNDHIQRTRRTITLARSLQQCRIK